MTKRTSSFELPKEKKQKQSPQDEYQKVIITAREKVEELEKIQTQKKKDLLELKTRSKFLKLVCNMNDDRLSQTDKIDLIKKISKPQNSTPTNPKIITRNNSQIIAIGSKPKSSNNSIDSNLDDSLDENSSSDNSSSCNSNIQSSRHERKAPYFCNGENKNGTKCHRSMKSSDKYCHYHKYQSKQKTAKI